MSPVFSSLLRSIHYGCHATLLPTCVTTLTTASKETIVFLAFYSLLRVQEQTSGGWGVRRCVWWFHLPCLEAAPRALSTWSSEPREGQAVWRAKAAPWPSVILRPVYWPGPLHDAVRISLNLTRKFGHYLTHRQPWTAVAISPLLGLISMA